MTMTLVRLSFAALVALFTLSHATVTAAAEAAATAADTNPGCAEWAERGECAANPAFMLVSCATSCAAIKAQEQAERDELKGISSFFELSAQDIDGKEIKFDQFRGQVTILTNVASYCGYTESHYKGLVELWSQLKHESVHILAFPCNQFGKQEPGSAAEIKAFAQDQGVDFTMMSKINVNGPTASKVYKYLKQATGVSTITWNFATYFVVGPDGSITEHTGVEPLDLKGYALSLLKEEL
jgi:glutathione peroxidase